MHVTHDAQRSAQYTSMPRDSRNASHMEEKERRIAPSCSQSASKETASIQSPSTHSASGQESDINLDLEGDKLDVCSESFDPLLALYSSTVPLPFPNIKCFNNVAEYEGFLKGGRGRAKPENVEKKRRKAMKGVADPERIERLKKLMVHNPVQADGETSGTTRRKKQKAHKNVLTRMPLCKGSPLGELHRCVEERIRVKVHIRTFKGLRGVCSGFVVAFDKFWNMAMVDVDETYREPLLGEAFYHEKALTVTRLFEKLQLQECTEGNEHPGKHKAKGKSTIPQQETSAAALTSVPRDLASRGTCGHIESKGSRTDPRLPAETVKVTEDEGRAHVKACRPETSQSAQGKSAKPYGKVHSRYINQLFIRGENVLLVNLQPL